MEQSSDEVKQNPVIQAASNSTEGRPGYGLIVKRFMKSEFRRVHMFNIQSSVQSETINRDFSQTGTD